MGGGLAAPSRGASPGRGAPDGAELLPRQAVGARDAAAQDAATDSLRAPGRRSRRRRRPGGSRVWLLRLQGGRQSACVHTLAKEIPSIFFFF